MSFNRTEELRMKYNEILDILIKKIESSERLVLFKDKYTDEDLDNILEKFCKQLETDKKQFKLFIHRNERVFGNKIGLKIVPSISLKNIDVQFSSQ